MQGAQGLEAKLEHIIDALPGLVWTALPDGNIDFLNRRWLEYTGLNLEEICGTGWQSIIHPEDLPALLKGLGSIRATHESREMEARIRRADGEYRWFLFRSSPLAATGGASGQAVGWCGIGTDIDDRKRGEELLRESEQQFRAIFDEAGAGITLLDLNSDAPLRNNRAMKAMLNCSDEELRTVEMFTALTAEKNRDLDLELFVELRHGNLSSLDRKNILF